VWNNGTAGAQPIFQQYLKSTKQYTVQEINVYPTIGGVVQIVSTLAFAWTSDTVLKGRRWPAILIGAVVNIICYGSLWAWNIPTGWKWAVYIINPIGAATAGLIMS
jgi:MFS transporter, ACS family, pantothenate transporter